mmetsp:Transcript_17019/g.40551  ORF Transcript_17019/g.40551 Transcript_17019/m.40551 type:complete len:247 (-) Transcript_17019:188-928(-)
MSQDLRPLSFERSVRGRRTGCDQLTGPTPVGLGAALHAGLWHVQAVGGHAARRQRRALGLGVTLDGLAQRRLLGRFAGPRQIAVRPATGLGAHADHVALAVAVASRVADLHADLTPQRHQRVCGGRRARGLGAGAALQDQAAQQQDEAGRGQTTRAGVHGGMLRAKRPSCKRCTVDTRGRPAPSTMPACFVCCAFWRPGRCRCCPCVRPISRRPASPRRSRSSRRSTSCARRRAVVAPPDGRPRRR